MTSQRKNYWILAIIFLIIAMLSGGIVLAAKQSQSQTIEITLPSPTTPELPDKVYVGGAVANPGFYPSRQGDTLEDILKAAGGIEPDADLGHLKIYVPEAGEASAPQKIDVNRAEAWLLEALPEIGPGRAQAIINYRTEKGPFQNIIELTKVGGIGSNTFEKIKDLITVKD